MKANRLAGILMTFGLASSTTFSVAAAAYGDTSHPTRFMAVLIAYFVIGAIGQPRLVLSREILLYLSFVGYSLLSIGWANDVNAAIATVPALVTCLLVLVLFSAMAAYRDIGVVLGGMLVGFLVAAVRYTLISGYPFTYPEEFSYNTIAGLYLFGLFITLVFGTYQRWTILPLALGTILFILIGTTTSIKTNLGFALGFIGAAALYLNFSVKSAVKQAVLLSAIASVAAYGVMSNEALSERLQNGYGRVSTGLAVLTNREGDSGGIGLGTRQGWRNEGLKGWANNPVFGYGVEAFRADFGITSHSTPIDLLYNSGAIGCTLFYGLLVSIAARLLNARNPERRDVRARIAIFTIAYAFISLSGIMYYDPFLAIFVGVSSSFLTRFERAAINADDVAESRSDDLVGYERKV